MLKNLKKTVKITALERQLTSRGTDAHTSEGHNEDQIVSIHFGSKKLREYNILLQLTDLINEGQRKLNQ